MKQPLKSLYVALLVIIFSSCKNEPIMFDRSKTYVGFDITSTSVFENNTSLEIPVMVAGFEGSGEVTVNYEISVDGIAKPAIEGVDFTIGSGGTVDFPQGAGYSNITIHPIDNGVFTGNKSFKINIISNSKNYPIGRENSMMVTIKDDEHPLKKWIGNYAVNAVSYFSPGDYDENWTVTTDADPDNFNNLLISGVGAPGSDTIKATLNLDEMTITLAPGQPLGDVYGYGSISVYKGTDAGDDIIQDEPLIGVIEDDGTIRIDLWGELITDGANAGYLWDVFNTTWTKQ
jgi:hypothetical protein